LSSATHHYTASSHKTTMYNQWAQWKGSMSLPRALGMTRRGWQQTVEHPFGTLKLGTTHFLVKTLPRVIVEMNLQAILQPQMNDEDNRNCRTT